MHGRDWWWHGEMWIFISILTSIIHWMRRSVIKTLGSIAMGMTQTLVSLGIVGQVLAYRTNGPASSMKEKTITDGAFSFRLVPPLPPQHRVRHLRIQAFNLVILSSSAHHPALEIWLTLMVPECSLVQFRGEAGKPSQYWQRQLRWYYSFEDSHWSTYLANSPHWKHSGRCRLSDNLSSQASLIVFNGMSIGILPVVAMMLVSLKIVVFRHQIQDACCKVQPFAVWINQLLSFRLFLFSEHQWHVAGCFDSHERAVYRFSSCAELPIYFLW